MKGLVYIHASVDFQYYPYFLVNVPKDVDQEGLMNIVSEMLPTHFGDDEESVHVDEDGVCWKGSRCWYVEGTYLIPDEDADHLVRILDLSVANPNQYKESEEK